MFVALRRITSDIYYYRTRNLREADFVARQSKRPPLLVQVSESLRQLDTHKRELVDLQEAMAELGLESGLVVTRSEAERIEFEGGVIEVVPA